MKKKLAISVAFIVGILLLLCSLVLAVLGRATLSSNYSAVFALAGLGVVTVAICAALVIITIQDFKDAPKRSDYTKKEAVFDILSSFFSFFI